MGTTSSTSRRFTVDLDSDLRRKLKLAAFEEDRPLSNVFRELAERWLAEREGADARRAVGSHLYVPPPLPGMPGTLISGTGRRLPVMRPREIAIAPDSR